MSQVEGAPKGTLDFICNRSLEILHDTSFKYSQSNLKVWCKDRQIDFNDSTKRNLQDALQALRWGGQLDGWETWRATVLVNQIIRESQENRSRADLHRVEATKAKKRKRMGKEGRDPEERYSAKGGVLVQKWENVSISGSFVGYEENSGSYPGSRSQARSQEESGSLRSASQDANTLARHAQPTAAIDGRPDDGVTAAAPPKRARLDLEQHFPDENHPEAISAHPATAAVKKPGSSLAASPTRDALADLPPNQDPLGDAALLGATTPEEESAWQAVDSAADRREAAEAEMLRLQGEARRRGTRAALEAYRKAELVKKRADVAYQRMFDELVGDPASSASSTAPSASGLLPFFPRHSAAHSGAPGATAGAAAAVHGTAAALSDGASAGTGAAVAGEGASSFPPSSAPTTTAEHPLQRNAMTEKPIIPPRDNAPAAESRKKPSRAPADDTLPAPQTNPSDMQVDSGATNSLSTAPMQKIKPSPVPGTRKPHKDAPPNVKANPSSTRTGGKTAAWLGGSGAVAWEIQIETEGSLEKGKTNSDLTNKRKCDASAGGTKPDGVPPKEAATEEDNPIDHVAKAAVGARPSDGGRKRRWSASLEPVAEDELEEGEFRPDVENAEGATCPLAVAAGDPMLNTPSADDNASKLFVNDTSGPAPTSAATSTTSSIPQELPPADIEQHAVPVPQQAVNPSSKYIEKRISPAKQPGIFPAPLLVDAPGKLLPRGVLPEQPVPKPNPDWSASEAQATSDQVDSIPKHMDNRDLATATPPDGEDQFGEFNLGIDFPSAAGPPFNFAEAKEKLHVMFDSLDDNLARIEALAAVIGGSPKFIPTVSRNEPKDQITATDDQAAASADSPPVDFPGFNIAVPNAVSKDENMDLEVTCNTVDGQQKSGKADQSSLGDGLEHTPVDDATFRRCFFGPNPMLAKKSMSSSVSKGQEPEIYKNKDKVEVVKTGPAAALLDSSVDGAPFVGIEEYEDDDDMLVDHADVSLYQVSPPKKQTETAAPHAFTAAAATTYDEKKLVKSPSNAAGVVREGKGGAAIVASTDEMRYNATPEKNGLDGMDDSRGEETGADGAMEGTRGGEGQMVNKAEWNPEKLGYTVLFNPGFENS